MIKRIVLVNLLTLSFSFFAVAQTADEKERKKHQAAIENSRKKNSVIVSLDTIFNAGKPYGILRKEEAEVLSFRYNIYALNGEEAMYADAETMPGKLILTFSDLEDESAYLNHDITSTVAKTIVQHNLLLPTGLNEASAEKLVKDFPKPAEKKLSKLIKEKTEAGPANRDRTKPVFAEGGSIMQDGQLIGTYNQAPATENAANLIFINFPDGKLCAKFIPDVNGKSVSQIITSKDSKTHNVGKKMTLDEAAKYLVDRQYF